MGSCGGCGGGDEQLKRMAELRKTLKEGERILAPTRRPDGTLRKPIRIRAGYVPQDEVAIYQSKGALLKKGMSSSQEMVPPGYDPVLDAKPKTKSAKRNERKKEKRLQAALEKGNNSEAAVDGELEKEELPPNEDLGCSESHKSLTSQMNELLIVDSSPADSMEASVPSAPSEDTDKKIRALRKKIRQAEAQQQKTAANDMKPEQLEKLTKLDGWREELRILEDKKTEHATS
ncbi:hypothetical protein K2173_021157 [Erythroxylum novogranatense]|uniref:WIBG Mago-binding domain-containing protein n=1 Tax=Erythroxylum novogranatense TaxID=1862640 RepID=A0AAV8TMN6_9ROSI|nr:hypothetical protein K2173_021157 [Erythroxylum novogranatense]